MKSEKQVVYDNLYMVLSRIKNAFQGIENPYKSDVKVSMSIVDCNRIEDALRYIKSQPETNQNKDSETKKKETINENKTEQTVSMETTVCPVCGKTFDEKPSSFCPHCGCAGGRITDRYNNY